jgi:hypothetical protein
MKIYKIHFHFRYETPISGNYHQIKKPTRINRITWLMQVIPDTQAAELGRLQVEVSLGKR